MGISTSKNKRTIPIPVPRVHEYMANPPKHVNPTKHAFQTVPAGPWPPQNYNYNIRSPGWPGYSTQPMPHGMMGMTVGGREFRLPKTGGPPHAPRLVPTFGIPPTRNEQTALPSYASALAMSRHGQSRSERSRAQSEQAALPGYPSAVAMSRHGQGRSEGSRAQSQQTALPGYASAVAMSRHGQGRSEGSRARGQSSRHQQSRSGQMEADNKDYELGDECKDYELEDECSQWEPSCALQTVSEEQKEMPMATKRMMKESGICIRGFNWTRQIYDGWRCEGGNHFVFDNQGAADRFLQEWLPKMMKEIKKKQTRGR